MRPQSKTRLMLQLLCSVAVLSGLNSGPASAQEAPPTPCDIYAASEVDPQRTADAIPDDKIDASLAVPACTAAVAQYPNSARLIYQLGRSFEAERNVGKAVEQYRKAAEQGYAAAQLELANAYADGVGIARDDAQAVAWLRQAAEQGNADAQLWLGFMYYDGRGVIKDDAQALAWLRKAAEQGNVVAQNNLDAMINQRNCAAKDETEERMKC